jgi:hypothetical protein
MLRARTWRGRLALQIVLTLMVLPFLFPLVAMVPPRLSS